MFLTQCFNLNNCTLPILDIVFVMHAHDKHRIVLDNDMAMEKYYFFNYFFAGISNT